MSNTSNSFISRKFMEAARAGCANAGKSLEMLVEGRLHMEVLWVGNVQTSTLSELSGSPEEVVIGVYVLVHGDVPGHALLLFPAGSALVLSDIVMGLPVGTTTELGDMEVSLIKEVANILTSSYLTSMAERYEVTLLPSPPVVATDMAAAIIDAVLTGSGMFEPETISIVTRFRGTDRTIDGFFLYIPEIVTMAESEAA